MRYKLLHVIVLAAIWSAPAAAAIDFVGNLNPPGDSSTPIPQGAAGGLNIRIEVGSPATSGSGQGAGIECLLEWALPDDPVSELTMSYAGDAGSNDRYEAFLPASGLAPGNYRFRARCSDDGGQTQTYMTDNDGLLSITPAPLPPPGNVFVQLFEWKWTDVAQECQFLADAGYTGVQVSAPNEHLDPAFVGGAPWWVRYQPLSYRLVSRSGTEQEFIDMVAACDAAGVDVYIDAVINHMAHAGFNAQGTDGSTYTGNSYAFPGVWTPAAFHYCGTNPGQPTVHDLNDFSDRFEVQNCELLGLADLDSGNANVRTGLRNFLQNVMDIGVDGFRVDAAKHTDASDLRAIFDGLNPAPYAVQEVIDSGGEEVRYWEYLVNGDVTDFGYVFAIGSRFECGAPLAGLSFLNAIVAEGADFVVFTDNHDTQRQNNCSISHQTGATAYDLANVFMLAHPYGYPRVMSSYYFGDFNQGPPSTGGVTDDVWIDSEPVGCNGTDWVCEHRRPAIANMARFRQVTAGQGVTDWWDDGNDRIAFGRGAAGFVAINTDSGFTRTYQTSMAAGSYCNIARYSLVDGLCVIAGTGAPAPAAAFIEVDAAGQLVDQFLAANGALAIHGAAMASPPDSDDDGVADGEDNCTVVANADQRDTNADGYGNVCDPDVDNDGAVNFADLQIVEDVFFAQSGQPSYDPDADFDGDGGINFGDLNILKAFFFGHPGPGLGIPDDGVCGPPASALDPADAFGAEMFLRGSFNGWAAVPGSNNFVNVGNDRYVAELELAPGDYDYKVASADWSIERTSVLGETLLPGAPLVLMDNGGGSPNSLMSVPGAGCWRFELTTTDPAAPVLSMQPE